MAAELSGAILVFLPGVGEINMLLNRLSSSKWLANEVLLPLHSSLPAEKQRDVFPPPPTGKRKIVAATNIAETSITINDIVHVIDTGRVKEVQYHYQTGMSSLEETFISKASAKYAFCLPPPCTFHVCGMTRMVVCAGKERAVLEGFVRASATGCTQSIGMMASSVDTKFRRYSAFPLPKWCSKSRSWG